MKLLRFFPFLICILLLSLPLFADDEDFLDSGKGKDKKIAIPPSTYILFATKARAWNPVWLLGEERIACLCNEGGSDEIWIVDLKKEAKQITKSGGEKSSLLIVPGMEQFVYVSGKENNRNIHLVSWDGSGDRLLTNGWNPSIGPDGKNIAFDTAKGPMMASLEIDKAVSQKLEFPKLQAITDSYPHFFSQGKIIYCQEGHVYLYNCETQKLEQFVNKTFQELNSFEFAKVSPDGKVIALYSTNESALSKPASTWIVPNPRHEERPREVCLGKLLQWKDNEYLLLVKDGVLFEAKAFPNTPPRELTKGVYGCFSPGGKNFVFEFICQDTNGDGLINWRDGSSLFLLEVKNE